MQKRLCLSILCILGILRFFSSYAFARTLTIQNFADEVIVNRDATIDVTEKITARFEGAWNGIYRKIPVVYQTPQGFKYDLLLDIGQVTDDQGAVLKVEKSREGDYLKLKIWVPDAVDTTHTVTLPYHVENELRFFEDHDELYWNVTGTEWEVPIESASAKITLPQGVEGIRTVSFTGGYGSKEDAASSEVQGNVITFHTLQPLNYREGLTIAVAWNTGLITRPSPAKIASYILRSNTIFALPVLVFIFMFMLWYRRGRDPRLQPIAPAYDSPEGMTPAEAGTLMDNSADMRDITATIVDLAVRGYLEIEGHEKTGLVALFSRKDYTFKLKKKDAEWANLLPHEQEILNGMFAHGEMDWVNLSDLENKFYLYLPEIKNCIFEKLLARHYYLNRPDNVKRGYLALAAVVAIAVSILAAIKGDILGFPPTSTIIAGLLSAASIGGFGFFMPIRTYLGTRALAGVLGLEEFLHRVEEDRFARVIKTPDMFEKLLPYAMAFGVEKNWAGAFADICREPPNWYHGSSFSSFSTGNFVSDLGHMSSQASSSMASSPRSSGSSGFGGGGSSGGGGGGGGGGGF